jgi:hypothetical protein
MITMATRPMARNIMYCSSMGIAVGIPSQRACTCLRLFCIAPALYEYMQCSSSEVIPSNGVLQCPKWFSFIRLELEHEYVKLDRLCGLVVRVLGYRSGGPGSIPGTTIKEK